jgi:hypothetical protein
MPFDSLEDEEPGIVYRETNFVSNHDIRGPEPDSSMLGFEEYSTFHYR